VQLHQRTKTVSDSLQILGWILPAI